MSDGVIVLPSRSNGRYDSSSTDDGASSVVLPRLSPPDDLVEAAKRDPPPPLPLEPAVSLVSSTPPTHVPQSSSPEPPHPLSVLEEEQEEHEGGDGDGDGSDRDGGGDRDTSSSVAEPDDDVSHHVETLTRWPNSTLPLQLRSDAVRAAHDAVRATPLMPPGVLRTAVLKQLLSSLEQQMPPPVSSDASLPARARRAMAEFDRENVRWRCQFGRDVQRCILDADRGEDEIGRIVLDGNAAVDALQASAQRYFAEAQERLCGMPPEYLQRAGAIIQAHLQRAARDVQSMIRTDVAGSVERAFPWEVEHAPPPYPMELHAAFRGIGAARDVQTAVDVMDVRRQAMIRDEMTQWMSNVSKLLVATRA